MSGFLGTPVFDGGRWYAHSSMLVGYGMIPLLLGRGYGGLGRLPAAHEAGVGRLRAG
ncbi:hypothetical protein [Streptomyces globisporus]|uniref:hypothetical protein n=1 Tax=Streptomyces globisporus TaxID=1908 RepID=UPI0037F43E31